jgi:taurine dioxygenase
MEMLTSKLDITRLAPALGAQVTGADITGPISESDRAFLRKTWDEHLVLVIRDIADLSADQHKAFCEIFGEIGARARPQETRHEPDSAPAEVMYVSNKRVNDRLIGSIPDGEMEFHIDQCYTTHPAKAGCLYAVEVPASGGDTMFGNLYLAYDTLAPDLRRAVEGRRAWNVYGHSGYGIQTRTANDPKAAQRRQLHPVVCTHPKTGRKVLYVNRLMTAKIDGLPDNESDDILLRLFDHQEKPEFRYTHKWRAGDLLLWDNRCTIHARTDFDPAQTRHLRRFSVRGHDLS